MRESTDAVFDFREQNRACRSAHIDDRQGIINERGHVGRRALDRNRLGTVQLSESTDAVFDFSKKGRGKRQRRSIGIRFETQSGIPAVQTRGNHTGSEMS